MAGLVGVVRGSRLHATFDPVLRVLCHAPGSTARILYAEPPVSLGMVVRHGYQGDYCFEEMAGGRAVALYGFTLERGPGGWRRLGARDLLHRFADVGVAAATHLDGSFIAAFLDRPTHRLFLVNDRHASLPLHYAAVAQSFAFAPEAKAIFQLVPLRPALDPMGALQLLNTGHTFGGQTLFEGVETLRPAHLIEVDLASAMPSIRPYWDLEFEPDQRLGLHRAAARLFEAVREAQGALAVLGANRMALALTGGFDSRLVLGTLPELPGVELEAFSWGVAGDLPGSDPAIARELASEKGLPFRFLRYRPEDFADNWSEWLYVSELSAANLGYFAAGSRFLADASGTPDIVLTGDHLVGLGGYPASRQAALEAVTFEPFAGLHPCLAPLVRREVAGDLAERYESMVLPVADACPSGHPRDLQDYLFFHLHAPGWLWSAGFYKEPMAFAFRPLLLSPVRDVCRRLPAAHRGDKRVLVEAVRRYLPGLRTHPIASGNSAIDWRYDSLHVPSLRAVLEDLTAQARLSETCVARIVDRERFARFRETYLASDPAPVSRQPSAARRLTGVRRVFIRNRLTARAAGMFGRQVGAKFGGRRYQLSAGAAHRVMFRVALLAAFEQMVSAGAFSPRLEKTGEFRS